MIGEMKTYAFLLNLLFMAFLVNGNAVSREEGEVKKVLCYFEAINSMRSQVESRFFPEDIDVTICTHVVYNRAFVSYDLEVVPRNITVDLEEDGGLGLYNRTVALKNLKPGLKVFLDVYEFDRILGEHLASGNTSAIAAFARNAADFVQNHGFDGMNFRQRHAESLSDLAPILHEEFARRGIPLMTIILPRNINTHFQVEVTEEFSRNFDLLVVASYWRISGEQTEIFSSMVNLERAVDEYKSAGVPTEKLLVAIPIFSVSMKLCESDQEVGALGSTICDGGEEGTFEGDAKMILHNSEMRKKMANESEEWVVVRDEVSKVPYGYSHKSHLWAAFEDQESVREKVKFILERGLAGASIMNMDMEDFKGQYTEGGEKFPLTRAVFNALNGQE